MTAYAYLRKSSVRDPAREVSYQVQETSVRKLADLHGDGEPVILSDWDKSGRLEASKRPAYQALLDAIRSGAATAVYSYSLSRLARSTKQLLELATLCRERSVPLRLHADSIDTSSASGMMVYTILGAVATFEAEIAQERQAASNAAKLARGQSLRTVRLYGEGADDDAAAVLAAFREAGSFSGAAKLLNARGIKPRNRTRRKNTPNADKPPVWWPSSVSVVVKRLDATVGTRRPSRGYAAGGTDFTLARLLRCPTCGTALTGTRDRGGKRVRYSCRLGTATPHPRISVTESHILPAIRAEADRLRAPGRVEAGREDTTARAELEARRARIVDLFEAGHIDRADRERRLEAVSDGLARLDDRAVVIDVPTIDWTAEPRKVNAVLRAMFERIDLDPETFQPVAFEWTVPEWRA